MGTFDLRDSVRDAIGSRFGFTLAEINTLYDAMHTVWGVIAYDVSEMLGCDPCDVPLYEKVELICDASRMETFSDTHSASPELLKRFHEAMQTTDRWDELPSDVWRAG